MAIIAGKRSQLPPSYSAKLRSAVWFRRDFALGCVIGTPILPLAGAARPEKASDNTQLCRASLFFLPIVVVVECVFGHCVVRTRFSSRILKGATAILRDPRTLSDRRNVQRFRSEVA